MNKLLARRVARSLAAGPGLTFSEGDSEEMANGSRTGVHRGCGSPEPPTPGILEWKLTHTHSAPPNLLYRTRSASALETVRRAKQ